MRLSWAPLCFYLTTPLIYSTIYVTIRGGGTKFEDACPEPLPVYAKRPVVQTGVYRGLTDYEYYKSGKSCV